MKKIILRFSILNLLISLVLFVAYRIVISQTKTIDGNSFEEWLQILDYFLNIGFSLMYLVAMVSSSFLILLNQIEKIRNNVYLSFLTFLGISLCCLAIVLIDIQSDTLTMFSATYIFLTAMAFLFFRKRVLKYSKINS